MSDHSRERELHPDHPLASLEIPVEVQKLIDYLRLPLRHEQGAKLVESLARDLATVRAEKDAAIEDARMGHVRLDETRASITKGQGLYARISWLIERLHDDWLTAESGRLAAEAERDEQSKRADGLAHRRSEAQGKQSIAEASLRAMEQERDQLKEVLSCLKEE